MTIEELVTTELKRRGHRASYEYPGFVSLADDDGTSWDTGTANDTWTIDHMTTDGRHLGGADTDIRTDCADPQVIADEVERRLGEMSARTKD
jgi:hypothetical protein